MACVLEIGIQGNCDVLRENGQGRSRRAGPGRYNKQAKADRLNLLISICARRLLPVVTSCSSLADGSPQRAVLYR